MKKQIIGLLQQAKEASRRLPLLPADMLNRTITDLAERLQCEQDLILQENAKDLARLPSSDPRYDRLQLTPSRLEATAKDLLQVACLECPLGKILDERTLPNGLWLRKISVPLGVVGIIYEARPNVTLDAFALCLKAGNACVLRGGSDAQHSNRALTRLIHQSLQESGLPPEAACLLPANRQAAEIMLKATGWLDVVIPRGGQELIRYVRQTARVPIIETGAGIVHTYFDPSADLEKGRRVIFNAKTRRPSVCNALDCLIIHQGRLADLFQLVEPLASVQVQLFADPPAWQVLLGHYPADYLQPAVPEHYGTEFLSLKMAIKTVSSLEEALTHIADYGSQHSEAILAEDERIIDQFLRSVDAAAVYANTSTAFTDGAQFGMGAEIGISTQKLHARGPMALSELTSYKWLIRGNGQIRMA